MYKAIIFDMDGVLIDSQPFHFEVDRLTLQKCGFPATLESVKPYAGMATDDRFKKYKKDYNIEKSVQEIIDTCENVRNDLLKTAKFEAIDGVIELLQSLKNKGIKTAVASSSSYDFIFWVLDTTGIRNYFDIVMSGEQMRHSKPAPDIFLATADKLNVSPDECIVIEDSANGVMAAFNAKMKCVGYINPNSGEQDISRADIKIDNFFDIVNSDDWLKK